MRDTTTIYHYYTIRLLLKTHKHVLLLMSSSETQCSAVLSDLLSPIGSSSVLGYIDQLASIRASRRQWQAPLMILPNYLLPEISLKLFHLQKLDSSVGFAIQ